MMTHTSSKNLKILLSDFNKNLETVLAKLEQLETVVKAIVENIRTEINELSIKTDNIIGDMNKDLEQRRTMITKILKLISCLRLPSLTISTTSPAKPRL